MRWLLAPLILASTLVSVDCPAATDSADLRRVKAAFVLNIARFVSWPADAFDRAGAPLSLCFYRSNPLGAAVATIRGKKVGRRRLDVSTIAALQEAGRCHVLFVPSAELARFASEGPTDRPLLTMTDRTDPDAAAPASRGIMVTLVRSGTRIGFEIDLGRVRGARLDMSAELLKLARIVGTP